MTITGQRGRRYALLGCVVLHSLTTGCADTNSAGSGLAEPATAPQKARQAAQLNPATPVAQETIAACTDLVVNYAVFRDQGDVAGYVGLFASDGVLTLRGNTISGHAAIRKRVRTAGAGPLTVPGFTAIGDYVDEFVRTDAGWRIAKRRFDVQFLLESREFGLIPAQS